MAFKILSVIVGLYNDMQTNATVEMKRNNLYLLIKSEEICFPVNYINMEFIETKLEAI